MSLGIPYMGSKRKLSKKIIDHIIVHNPNCKYIYDLFGGGGAISFEALKRKQFKGVYYNELNTGVVELLKKIKKDGVTKEFYEWVSREEFKEKVNDNDWKGGLIKTIWSFGNNQKDYLFSDESEYIKNILHEIIINDSKVHIEKFKKEYNIFIDTSNIKNDSFINRRLKIMSFLKKEIKERLDLQKLQKLEQLEQLGRLQQLERLGRLGIMEQLGRLGIMEQLEISNLSYNDVIIKTPIDETVIYLDPPYFDTAKYQKDINDDDFLSYVNSSPYKIYMSSYELPFNKVASFQHTSTLSRTANNKVTENLYCNREELKIQQTLF